MRGNDSDLNSTPSFFGRDACHLTRVFLVRAASRFTLAIMIVREWQKPNVIAICRRYRQGCGYRCRNKARAPSSRRVTRGGIVSGYKTDIVVSLRVPRDCHLINVHYISVSRDARPCRNSRSIWTPKALSRRAISSESLWSRRREWKSEVGERSIRMTSLCCLMNSLPARKKIANVWEMIRIFFNESHRPKRNTIL